MKNRVAYVIIALIPFLMITGILWMRNLSEKGIQIMPHSIALCVILTALFFSLMYLLRRKV